MFIGELPEKQLLTTQKNKFNTVNGTARLICPGQTFNIFICILVPGLRQQSGQLLSVPMDWMMVSLKEQAYAPYARAEQCTVGRGDM